MGTLEYMPPEILRLPSTDLVVKGLVAVDDIAPVDEKVGLGLRLQGCWASCVLCVCAHKEMLPVPQSAGGRPAGVVHAVNAARQRRFLRLSVLVLWWCCTGLQP